MYAAFTNVLMALALSHTLCDCNVQAGKGSESMFGTPADCDHHYCETIVADCCGVSGILNSQAHQQTRQHNRHSLCMNCSIYCAMTDSEIPWPSSCGC